METISPGQEFLLRTLSYALRHSPREFFLEVDADGWADLDCVVLAMRYARPAWTQLSVEDIRRLAGPSDSARFEIAGGIARRAGCAGPTGTRRED